PMARRTRTCASVATASTRKNSVLCSRRRVRGDAPRKAFRPILSLCRSQLPGSKPDMPRSSVRSVVARGIGVLVAALSTVALAQTSAASGWDLIVAKARGQTVHFNAWAGDERTNAFIAWVGEQVKARYGVTVDHVRLKDTSEAVTRVIAEKSAGRESNGTVDLIWINGPNFLSLKTQKLLYGPFTAELPNFKYVDTVNKRSNVIDFTTPVDGLAAPWRMAQIVFVYDSARIKDAKTLPRSARDLAEWARANPGRTTHPSVRNFLGSTFLKQALYELAP